MDRTAARVAFAHAASTWAEISTASISNLDVGGVETTDLITLIPQWGPCSAICDGDLNHHSSIEIDDLLPIL